jgi:hypothetical protein
MTFGNDAPERVGFSDFQSLVVGEKHNCIRVIFEFGTCWRGSSGSMTSQAHNRIFIYVIGSFFTENSKAAPFFLSQIFLDRFFRNWILIFSFWNRKNLRNEKLVFYWKST